VTPSDRAAAQAALGEGRAVYGRLDQIRGPEDAAADIMELWSAAESAMRAMLGGSTLSGQALVRELRQRGALNLEQANALASFWDARSRTDDVAYHPTLTDVGFARAGYNELGRAIAETGAAGAPSATTSSGAVPTSTFAPGGMPSAARPVVVPPDAAMPEPAEPARRSVSSLGASKPLLISVGVIALIIIAAAAAYFTMGHSKFDRQMADAVSLMTTGRTEAARSAFGAIAHEYPDRAQPHVFLSRLARSDSPPDMNTARQELITAIRLEPGYAPAQREMGIFQLADHNPSLARNFLIRAVQLAPNDSAAQGYLGCALMGLNRVAEAQKFLSRAGTGTWSSCATLPPTARAPITP
jgi:tetratricopeptide (TPR) repeat protein